ncbi:hypothetical protein K470DRAFT_254093 [Piedraia hortae CBS 480.64]|uniref:Uncharacterized protein n=1 Tax=Piedraia hortae CBS 480.64 TaxID=1314780 RepID=A0A6A7CAB2_9PEZI|nr:hypothetical protein K470DRAFT_254093 [Piedraia hortae CBS 480.64]
MAPFSKDMRPYGKQKRTNVPSADRSFLSEMNALISGQQSAQPPQQRPDHAQIPNKPLPPALQKQKQHKVYKPGQAPPANGQMSNKQRKKLAYHARVRQMAESQAMREAEQAELRDLERSRAKLEEKSRLYAAMKRGDIEDKDERYAVDFDRKWAERPPGEPDSEQEDDAANVEYVDEFGRTRKGTALEAANAADRDREDRFTARPSAPAQIIVGDTVQHAAFEAPAAMEDLASKRDRSPTPLADEHYESKHEVRSKGTGFFQFSADENERKAQMESLQKQREETERIRAAAAQPESSPFEMIPHENIIHSENDPRVQARNSKLESARAKKQRKRVRKQADDFLEKLGLKLAQQDLPRPLPS